MKQISEHFGESDGMLLPLYKDNTYKIIFNYKDSIINENNLSSCETYFTKISLAKVKYLKSKFPNAYSSTCNGANLPARRNEINKILKDFMDENKSNSNRRTLYNTNNNSSIPMSNLSNCNSGLSIIRDIKNIPGKNILFFIN